MADFASESRRTLITTPSECDAKSTFWPRAHGLLHANRGSLLRAPRTSNSNGRITNRRNCTLIIPRHPSRLDLPHRFAESLDCTDRRRHPVQSFTTPFVQRKRTFPILGFAFRFTTRVSRELTCSGKLTPDKSVIRLLFSLPVFSAAKLASFLL